MEVGVYGPPWEAVSDPNLVLQIDPPAMTACNALAAVVPAKGVLVRRGTLTDVQKSALALSRDLRTKVGIFRGAIRTRSGAWLWPKQVDIVDVTKADNDPLTREGLAADTEDLLQELLALADEAEAVAQLSGADVADLDWAQSSPAELEATIGRLEALIAGVPGAAAFAGPSQVALERATSRIARLSTLAGPGIAVGALTAAQLAVARRIGSSAGVFIRQEFGQRAGVLGQDARRLAASGVARGLSSFAIRQNVLGAFSQRLRRRDAWYFRIVSSTAASRARSFGQMVGYRQAGVDFYAWIALNDERTCEICRFLHGQVFPVTSPLQAFTRAMASPDPDSAMVDAFPWYRVVGGERIEGGLRRGGDIHIQHRGAPLGVQVATVRESGVGQREVTGTYTMRVNPRAAGGTLVPPAHGGCRCTTDAVT